MEQSSVGGASGAFTHSIPLEIPPGRSGLQPDLSLSYNSQNTADGIVGYGWSLSIPYIERLNKSGSQMLYATSSYFSSIDGELTAEATTTPVATTTSPSILDSLPLTVHQMAFGTSDSFSYTVPSGGSNKLLVALIHVGSGGVSPTSVTQNGVSATVTQITGGVAQQGYPFIAVLPAPSSGTFSISLSGSSALKYVVFTLQNAAQSNPLDDSQLYGNQSNTITTYATTTIGNTAILSVGMRGIDTPSLSGGGTQTFLDDTQTVMARYIGGIKAGGALPGVESVTMSGSSGSAYQDLSLAAIRSADQATTTAATSTIYRAKIDTGPFNLYSYSTAANTWTVYDKKGTKYTFGSTDSGRMYDTAVGTSTNTHRWMLQEIRDTNGNYITYTYNRDNNVLYPYHIKYTGNGSTDGISAVNFATSSRSDIRSSYATGFAATTTKVISRITAVVNGATARQYDLTYGVGHNGNRSLLTSVQQSGYDENNNQTTLPATTFTYATSSEQFYSPAVQPIFNQSYTVADTDGNGINDINLFMAGPGNGFMWKDNAATAIAVPDGSTPPPQYWATPPYQTTVPLERGVRYVDMNGDGKADAVQGWVDDYASESNFAIHFNQYSTTTGAYSWAATSTNYSGTIPTFAKRTSDGLVLTGGIIGDVNGDGLPDYVTALPGTVATTTYLGNGSAFDATTTVFVSPKSFPTSGQTETASQLVDINGDGLDDWVFSSSSKTYILINNGTGWNSTPDSRWTFATSTLYAGTSTNSYYDRGIRFLDINGDGLPDLVRAYKNTTGCSGEAADIKAVWLNTGSGWATSTAYSLPAYITSCSSGTLVNNEYTNFFGNGQQKQDVLVSLVNSKGGGTRVSYGKVGGVGSPIRLLAATSTVTHDGQGNYATTSYEFLNPAWHLASGVRDRRFAGFAVVAATSSNSASVTYYDHGPSLAHIGRPIRKHISDASGAIKQRVLYRWDTTAHGNSTFVGLGREVTEDLGADGSHRDKATEYQYSSTTNDVIQTIEYGEVASNGDGTFTDVGTDKRMSTLSYAASSTVNMSVPVRKTLFDYYSATTSDQKLYYDSLAFGSVNVGNGTKQEDWISGTTYASTTKTYNAFGLVATSTDRNGNATSYVYDAYNLFVATTTNALLQKTHAYFDYLNGKVKRSIDPNGRLALNLYDGLGRLKETAQSDVTTQTSYATTSVYAYTDSPASSVRKTDYLNSATSTDTYSYFDGLGRLIQTRKSSAVANVYAVTDRFYNGEGQLASSSLPYFSTGSASTTPTAGNLYTNYFYDGLQRVTCTSNAVGDTTSTYYQWKTTTTDPNGHIKDYIKDAFGNLAAVVEHLSGTSFATTTYAYDSQNNLATTTDALGNVRAFTYDALGRRLTAQDLHASADTTFGTWTYAYDHAGNLTSQTDPKSQVVNRTYDALNRMLTEDYTGQMGTEVALTYDSCTNGIGYLCIASSTSARTNNAYDILGRTSIATTTVSNASYAMSYTYDRQGNILTATYPDGAQAQYTYSAGGQVIRIERKQSGGAFSDVASYDYAPHGQVLNILFGNNASTTHLYDANALYRLSNLQTNSDGVSIQNFAYTYDDVGNITRIVNTASSSAAATTAYTYDALNRLLTAAATASSSPYVQAFEYDALGNILSIGSATSSEGSGVPTILDSLPVSTRFFAGTSDSFSYTVPSGGTSKLLIVLISTGQTTIPSATQNGTALTMTKLSQSANIRYPWVGVLAAPTSGTFSLTLSESNASNAYVVFTLQDAAQANPIDASYVQLNQSNSVTVSTSTTAGYDALLSMGERPNDHPSVSETTVFDGQPGGYYFIGGYKAGASSASTESMTMTGSGTQYQNLAMVAIKNASVVVATSTVTTYSYSGAGTANPHTVTQIANGYSSSTFAYDNNGNLTQKTTDGIVTTYEWTYDNRLKALGVNGATTTYGYDAFGSRVLQATATTTNIYPFKWFSVASSTGSGAQYASTTEYVWNGDALVATVDQQLAAGIATGSPQTLYIHPDHLGSTNVITNASGTVVATKDYYPYGSVRVNSGSAPLARGYIGQFEDQSNLSYLNARYYSSDRGQFISQDPTFLALGDQNRLKELSKQDQQKFLMNPQQMNAYSYGMNNPISNSDKTGNQAAAVFEALEIASYGQMWVDLTNSGYVASPMQPERQAQARASMNVNGPISVLAFAAVGPELPALVFGGAALGALDAYCSNFVCRNFAPVSESAPQRTPPVIMSMQTYTRSGLPANQYPPSGGNGNPFANGAPSNKNNSPAQGAGGGVSSKQMQQFVSDLSQFTALFRTFVDGLNSGGNNSNKR